MNDDVAALVRLDGWHGEGNAARVHYEGARERFAVEYYAPSEAVLYWSVPGGETIPTGGGADGGGSDEGGTGGTGGADEGETRGTDGAGTASPIARTDVPDPLRERIRRDLAAADIDPAVEGDRL